MKPEFVHVLGWVRAFAGPAPGPASGITYTIEYVDPTLGRLTLENQVPSNWRWPDDVLEIDPERLVGKAVEGWLSATKSLFWLFPGGEPPAFGDCEEEPVPAMTLAGQPMPGGENPMQPPTPGGSTPPPDSGPSQPPGGGTN